MSLKRTDRLRNLSKKLIFVRIAQGACRYCIAFGRWCILISSCSYLSFCLGKGLAIGGVSWPFCLSFIHAVLCRITAKLISRFHHCGIGDFRGFIPFLIQSLADFPDIRRNDCRRQDNPQHFGNDPADIQIRIRINPEIRIRISDHIGWLDALAEVALWAQSSWYIGPWWMSCHIWYGDTDCWRSYRNILYA